MMIEVGSPLCWPNSPGFQGVAPDRDQRVVLALGQGAVIVVDLFL